MTINLSKFFAGVVLIFLLLAGCSPSITGGSNSEKVSPELKSQDTQLEPELAEASSSLTDSSTLSAEPHKLTFLTSDGQSINAKYYPAERKDAPLIILMHWAQGMQDDWMEIAFWLQNCGLGGQVQHSVAYPWLQPMWFPKIDEGTSYAVFTFTFRNCDKNGCKGFERERWLIDVLSAVEYAHELEGINPKQIVTAGASIGADGALDGCAHLNSKYPESCVGAFAFSPGNYLTLPFAEVVSQLNEEKPATPVTCLYSETDMESFQVCNPIVEDNFNGIMYSPEQIEGFAHGMMLIRPDIDPNPLVLLLEFLENAFNS